MAARKIYAGQVRSINRDLSKTAVSCLVEVYGWYDNKAMATLHQRTPALVNVWIPKDHPLYDKVDVRSRLAIPAKGISVQAREAKGRRGEFDVNVLVGYELKEIVVLNELTLQDDDQAYTKTGTSLVVAAAEESVVKKLKGLFAKMF